uniref:Uncharacterized protein n=1 Tax=Ficus carica TaxID=3494 RepID=A0AA87YSS6_FICCA|nr:hypothetical protein TIFTF001_051226 [Ficus carica]GMN22631.1 hypothetical protein TIFTF001_051229 [Ficus carica]GMN74661.1 hypothetical protein TIFTF001_053192 [Ficus carica]GMN74677.1 hypothetical protein TIFTF001_053196 [Ficus carica]
MFKSSQDLCPAKPNYAFFLWELYTIV